jgi:hypothetical protein
MHFHFGALWRPQERAQLIEPNCGIGPKDGDVIEKLYNGGAVFRSSACATGPCAPHPHEPLVTLSSPDTHLFDKLVR